MRTDTTIFVSSKQDNKIKCNKKVKIMKFNFLKKGQNTTVNFENAKAYFTKPEIELYSAVVTTGLSDSFYEKDNVRLERIKSLISKCDPVFVAKLAVYTRNNMYLRSIPLVLVVELAKIYSGDSLVSKMITNVIQRADEITELLAYYQMANDRTQTKKLNKLSKQVQKGLAVSFNKFDEYQFAKYNRKGEVSLKDALFLVHPKAENDSQQAVFDKIVSDSLDVPYTWETQLSVLGQMKFHSEKQKEMAFKNVWEELIDSKKLGYMAFLRNLRNILQIGVSSAHIQKICHYLSDKNAVENSKQLPFRFLSAYREVKEVQSSYVSSVLDALEKAVMISAKNIQGFDFNTSVVIACDVSGSMQTPISPRSKVMLYDIGLILGMLMYSRCKNITSGIFGDKWKVINLPQQNVLNNVDQLYSREGEVGYSTNGYLVLEDLIYKRKIVDKIMIFTDVQMWNSNNNRNSFEKSWNDYKKIAPNSKLYLFDLAGYGQMPIDIKNNDVYLIAGWSDKIFAILDALENKTSAIEFIHQTELN